eukprot:1843472-Prymnesium_polylepis.1
MMRMCEACSSSRCSSAYTSELRRCTWTSYVVEHTRMPRLPISTMAPRSVFRTMFCRMTYARSLSPEPTFVVVSGSNGAPVGISEA